MAERGEFVDVVVWGSLTDLGTHVDACMRWADWHMHWLDGAHGWARSKYAGALNRSRWVELHMDLWEPQAGQAAVRLTCTNKSSIWGSQINLLEQPYHDLPGLVRVIADGSARQGRLVGVYPGRLLPTAPTGPAPPPPAAAPPPPPPPAGPGAG